MGIRAGGDRAARGNPGVCPPEIWIRYGDQVRAYLRLNLSTRPAVSMIFCVPV